VKPWAVAAVAILAVVVAIGGCDMLYTDPPLTITPDALADAQVGVPYDQRIDIAGNLTPAYMFSVQNGLLPAGLAIERVAGSTTAGRIFGTPLTAGTSTFEIRVACFGTNRSGQTGTKAYTLTVR
jgi:hypothetical protein